MQAFALIESWVQATVESASFPFLGGIDSFRTLNFAGDQQLEQTLERFRRDLLSRSAEEYRNQPGAMASLTDGLSRLRENAVQLARSDAREVISRFGQMGTRRLAAVG